MGDNGGFPQLIRSLLGFDLDRHQIECFDWYASELTTWSKHFNLTAITERGDIEIGDYLTTSGKVGHAMKQGDGILRNYTVAKAQEKVVWSEMEGDSKLIACTYHAQ